MSPHFLYWKTWCSLKPDPHFQGDAFWTLSVTYRDSGLHFTKDFSAYLNINDWLHYISSHIFNTQIQLMSRNVRGVRVRRKGRRGSLETWLLSRVSNTRKAGSRSSQNETALCQPQEWSGTRRIPCAQHRALACSLQKTRNQSVPSTEYVGYVSWARTTLKDNAPAAAKSPQWTTALLIISISYLQGARAQAWVTTLSVLLRLLLLYMR